MKKYLAAAAVIAVFTAGSVSAVAVTRSDSTAQTAARFVPADALVFATVALDPSVSQKAKILALQQRLPEAFGPDEASATTSQIVNDAVAEQGLDWERDIKPVLGDEIAGALLRPAGGGTEPTPVAIINVTDTIAAEDLIERQDVPAETYRTAGDYLLLSAPEASTSADAVAGLDAVQALIERGGPSLQDSPRYRAALDTLHDEHVALAWVDLPGIVDVTNVFDVDPALEAFYPMTGVRELKQQIEDTGALAMQAYAGVSSVHVRVTTEKIAPDARVGSGALMGALPVDTVAAIDVASFDPNTPGGVTEYLEEIERFGREFESSFPSDDVSTQTDNDFPAFIRVVKSLKGDAVAAVGKADISSIEELPFGAVITSGDPVETTRALDALSEALKDNDDLALSKVEVAGNVFHKFQSVSEPTELTTDGLVDIGPRLRDMPEERTAWYAGVVGDRLFISNTPDYLAQLVANQTAGLGSSPRFGEALGAELPTSVGSMFIDVEAVYEMITRYEDNSGETVLTQEDTEWLSVMKVGGVKFTNEKTHSRMDMTLVFK